MNKRNLSILLALLVVLAAAGFFLHASESDAMEQLCQAGAAAAVTHFQDYAATGAESDYRQGMAEFKSFMNAYLSLRDGVSDTNYLYCNAVYGQMALHPERINANLDTLLEALTLLAADYTDPNAYIRINNLQNELLHGS